MTTYNYISLFCFSVLFKFDRVVESKHPDHPVGKHFVGDYGWRDRTIINLKTQEIGHWFESPIQNLYDMGSLSKSLGLGVLGMPG